MRHMIQENGDYKEEWVNSDYTGDLNLYVSIKYTGKNSKKAKDRTIVGLDGMHSLINEIRERVELGQRPCSA